MYSNCFITTALHLGNILTFIFKFKIYHIKNKIALRLSIGFKQIFNILKIPFDIRNFKRNKLCRSNNGGHQQIQQFATLNTTTSGLSLAQIPATVNTTQGIVFSY